MHELSVLSQYMQREEGLLVDNLQKWRALVYSIAKRALLKKTTKNLLERGTIEAYVNDEIERIDTDFLNKYPNKDDRLLSAYNPRAFADFSLDRCSEGDDERQQLLDWHLFRDLARTTSYEESPPDLRDPELTLSLEDAPESSEGDLRRYSLAKRYDNFDWNNAVHSSITCFYNEMKQALDAQLVNKPHQFRNIDLLALDKHIILDVIEFNGDFENGFVDYVPNANFFNRGCPNCFIMEGDILDSNLRQQQILDSIEVLSSVTSLTSRIACVSIILYLRHKMRSHPPSKQRRPQTQFSAAKRLSREERSNIETESPHNIMTVRRNGPSILTVKLQQLALQWMHLAPGLGLDPGVPSNLAREGSLMKQ
ncbi:unnamed protein product [Cylicocyclus nassatus]|uniref:Uncharacterized protein n=1 Tax=Cylicocyclus nassatus TaxID=53992 RepID=A0AA36M8Z4_CYLNA|nr:unnamed protein product [Cylicocyclus nassatus]